MSDDRTWMFRLTFAVLVAALAVVLLQLALMTPGTGSGVVIAAMLVAIAMTLHSFDEWRQRVSWGSLLFGFILTALLSRLSLDAAWGSAPVVWAGVGVALAATGMFFSSPVLKEAPAGTVAASVDLEASPSKAEVSEILFDEEEDLSFNEEGDRLSYNEEGERLNEDDLGAVIIMGDRQHADAKILHCERVHAEEDESLEAILLLTLEPGEKHRYLHLRFEPFFSCAPIAECDCLSDGDVRAEFDVLNYYGGRISLRRWGDVSQSAELELSFQLSSGRARARAA